jgi:hypothetical protein
MLETAAVCLFACLWTHCTGPYLRRWVSDGCTKQDRQPEYPPSYRLGPKLRRTAAALGPTKYSLLFPLLGVPPSADI